jgi:hypothetical protein
MICGMKKTLMILRKAIRGKAFEPKLVFKFRGLDLIIEEKEAFFVNESSLTK